MTTIPEVSDDPKLAKHIQEVLFKREYGRNYYRLKHGNPLNEEEKAQKLIDRAKKLIEQKKQYYEKAREQLRKYREENNIELKRRGRKPKIKEAVDEPKKPRGRPKKKLPEPEPVV